MNFDLDALMENPQFVAGLSLLGGSSARTAPMLQALQSLQQMKKLKGDRELQQRKLSMEQEELESMKGYRKAQTESYNRQTLTAEENARREAANDLLTRQMLSSLGFLGGGTQPEAPAPNAPGAAAPSMPAPQTPAIPQLSKGGPTNAAEAAMAARVAGPMGADPKAIAREIAATTADLSKVSDPSSKEQLNAYLLDLKQQQSALGAPKVLGGSNEQQAKGHNDFQALAAQAEKHRKTQQALGVLRIMKRDAGGFGQLAEGLKPNYEAPKLQLDQDKFNYEQDKDRVELGLKDRQVGAAEAQARAAQDRANADLIREERQQVKAVRERGEKVANDRKAFGALHINTDLLNSKADTLAAHPGLERIFGIQGALPDYPGSDAANARQLQKSTIAQMAKETLAAIRDASKTGGALGNVSDKDIALLETAIASLDKAQSPAAAKEALKAVKEHSNRLRNLSATAYEQTYGESPFDKDLPVGARPTGQKSKRGLPLFKAPDGRVYEVEE